MNKDRFARLKQIILEVLTLPENKRNSYLDKVCGDDPELRHEIDVLLSHDLDLSKFGINREARDETSLVEEATPDMPDYIAGYRIIRILGEGGMGVVYEARQQSPKRSVALKVIRGGVFIYEHRVKLFRREAQALARLSHPGIASIYEAGRTEAGDHFFAMELIEGSLLNDYLRNNPVLPDTSREDVRTRLELFLQICHAVGYAHQHGVIHRDLKPSNIFVVDNHIEEESSEITTHIKILDFGLARITDCDVSLVTVATEEGKIHGTLSYMSPEQARGNPERIDLRSDIYSRGVILYEMMTGVLPLDIRRVLIHESVRVICEDTPKRPSTLLRSLRGDLETIVLKTLEKDPDRRYQSVAELAEDVRRYLSDEPILARPPSLTYQFKKLVVRHKALFAFAAALFVLITAFGVTMSFLYTAQRTERLRTEEARGRAEKVNLFLQEMLSSVAPEEARGREVNVRFILDEAAKRVDTELADQPEVQASARSALGTTYQKLGLFEEAERHLKMALEMRKKVFGYNHPDVARSLHDLGWLIHDKVGSTYDEEAERLIREALAIQKDLLGPEHPDIAMSLDHLGDLLRHKGEYVNAERLQREGLEMRKHLFGISSKEVAESLTNLGIVLHARGEYARAESVYNEALRTNTDLFGPEHPSVAQSMMHLARTMEAQGNFDTTEKLYRQVIDINRKLYDDNHSSIAYTLRYLALLLEKKGNLAEAESLHVEALEMLKNLFGEEHYQVAVSLECLADFYWQRRGNCTRAESMYREALAIRRKLYGDEHLSTTPTLTALGEVLTTQGRTDEALPYLTTALRIREESLPDDDWKIASTRVAFGGCLLTLGRYEEAETALLESERVLGFAKNAPPRRRRDCLEKLITLYETLGDSQKSSLYRAELTKLDQ